MSDRHATVRVDRYSLYVVNKSVDYISTNN